MDRREYRRKRRKKNQLIAYSITVLALIVVLGGILGGTYYGVNALDQKKAAEQLALEQEEAARLEAERLEQERLEAEAKAEAEAENESQVLPEDELMNELITTYLADMTIEEKVAGLFMVTPEQLTGVGTAVAAGNATKEAFAEYSVGGIIYFAKNIQSEDQLKEMISNTISYSKYPLFIGVDEEGGTVTRLAGSTLGIEDIGDMATIGATGDTTQAQAAGETIGAYLAEYGFNVDFAPVADVSTLEGNPIGDRSFSSDPVVAADMVASFVTGLESNGISGTVKHFPGHGNTDADSHDGSAVTEQTLEQMQEVEFLPFVSGIEAGVDFVMVGHISAPNVIGDDTPSSLSSMMVQEVLRTQLGYNGIVVTDAMNMGAITDSYTSAEAAILAIQAGVDVLLMPEDFKAAYQGVLDAVESGKITEERINESLARIYRVKYAGVL